MSITNIAVAVALALAAGSAHAVTIDEFTVAQSLADSAVTPPDSITGPTVAALGASSDFAERIFQMVNQTNPNGQAFGIDSNGGVLSVSKGPASTGEWWVEWVMLAGLSLDFTADGDTGIRFRIVENNAPLVRLTFDVTEGDGDHGVFHTGAPNVPSGSPLDRAFSYSRFQDDNPGVGDDVLDMTDIVGFSFHVDSGNIGNGIDLQMAFFETDDVPLPLPLPSTLLLLGAGLLGLRRLNG